MASCAIPIFFRPVRIGNTYFGDGGIRYTAPLSPAIFLGADQILTIGIRSAPSRDRVNNSANGDSSEAPPPSLADLAGTLLNAIFLEALESDVDRLRRINREVELLSRARLGAEIVRGKYIPILYLRPSIDLGRLAFQLHDTFPNPLKYLIRGLGVSSRKSWDFLSYLSFDRSYTRKLLDLGYQDTMSRREEVHAFFRERRGVARAAS
jgi:NTE family protein